jgi:hypothetical protein
VSTFWSPTPVLLVEQDPEERDLIGGWLENDGYDVLACPGPSAPDYACIGEEARHCPLIDPVGLSWSICGSPVTRGFRARRRLTSSTEPRADDSSYEITTLARARIAAWKARERHSLSCVFVPSTSITCRSVLPSPARISIRRGLASGATGIWIVSTPCS